jgi:hypothetical protein
MLSRRALLESFSAIWLGTGRYEAISQRSSSGKLVMFAVGSVAIPLDRDPAMGKTGK